jgi:hypothetical protein
LFHNEGEQLRPRWQGGYHLRIGVEGLGVVDSIRLGCGRREVLSVAKGDAIVDLVVAIGTTRAMKENS